MPSVLLEDILSIDMIGPKDSSASVAVVLFICCVVVIADETPILASFSAPFGSFVLLNGPPSSIFVTLVVRCPLNAQRAGNKMDEVQRTARDK